ncbi:MAG: putative ribonuclease 3 [Satyrvirus sp.]|uniref:Putative ribonuclease 3 n=1 Tax=Satyrvirus sp. TaxID=2487771 RepID=A0A3G5AGS1_9VIRU|nr:MAG: putative ribonuclease 3 [Satyrvirus sp.]
MNYNRCDNVINLHFIDYIIKSYVPELQLDTKKIENIDMDIFREAMLHESTKYENHHKTYERLEYLGDAIFHMVITEYLYKRYDEEAEGFLTRLRIRIERGDSMVDLTKILDLVPYIQLYGISLNNHILEDIFEAFIGAFYLNFGIKYTRNFIIKLIEKHKNLSELILYDDNYKDLLLRYFHQMKWEYPIYDVEKQKNKMINMDTKKFTMVVKNPKGEMLGRGSASIIGKAEQLASKEALIFLGVIVNGEIDHNWIDKIEKIEKDKKNKEKTDKKPMSVYNPNNKLMKKLDIENILSNYNVKLPKNTKINIKLFSEAMTHRSYLVRKKLTDDDKEASKNAVKLQKKSNERLKFLGDAIIHFIIGEHLFYTYDKSAEGFLTRLRCKLENRDLLFYLAKQTDIASYVLVSQNIEVLHGRNNINIISSGFESFAGAIYLEYGLSVVRQFVIEVMRIELDIDEIAENETNYKDLVTSLYYKNNWGRPEYKTIKEEGPDHSKLFTRGIYLNNKLVARGKASSKGKAEQIASKKMYEMFVDKLPKK